MRTPFTGQTVKGVFFMRYSYEFKRMCIELYRLGRYLETSDGVPTQNFVMRFALK